MTRRKVMTVSRSRNEANMKAKQHQKLIKFSNAKDVHQGRNISCKYAPSRRIFFDFTHILSIGTLFNLSVESWKPLSGSPVLPIVHTMHRSWVGNALPSEWVTEQVRAVASSVRISNLSVSCFCDRMYVVFRKLSSCSRTVQSTKCRAQTQTISS